MTARTAVPPHLVDELVAAELRALDRNLHRFRVARAARWRAPLMPDVRPTPVVERAAERIVHHQTEGVLS